MREEGELWGERANCSLDVKIYNFKKRKKSCQMFIIFTLKFPMVKLSFFFKIRHQTKQKQNKKLLFQSTLNAKSWTFHLLWTAQNQPLPVKEKIRNSFPRYKLPSHHPEILSHKGQVRKTPSIQDGSCLTVACSKMAWYMEVANI